MPKVGPLRKPRGRPFTEGKTLPMTVTSTTQPLGLALGIPTRGRPAILKETLTDLRLQTRRPDRIFVVYFEPKDVGDAPALFPEARFIQGKGSGGSCSQRNHLLDAAAADGHDLLFIQDDDFFAHRNYLERATEAFARDREIVGFTGKVLADGTTGPGYTVEWARSTLSGIRTTPTLTESPTRGAFNCDGCNMMFRLAVVQKHKVRFDEQMPGYAWYEDIDFSRRMMAYGKVVTADGAQGIHLGNKGGKTSGRRFGYSQVANPIYLWKKGSYPLPHAIRSIAKNVTANLVKSMRPEPYVDRHGRLDGNFLAFRDLLSARMHPERILKL